MLVVIVDAVSVVLFLFFFVFLLLLLLIFLWLLLLLLLLFLLVFCCCCCSYCCCCYCFCCCRCFHHCLLIPTSSESKPVIGNSVVALRPNREENNNKHVYRIIISCLKFFGSESGLFFSIQIFLIVKWMHEAL